MLCNFEYEHNKHMQELAEQEEFDNIFYGLLEGDYDPDKPENIKHFLWNVDDDFAKKVSELLKENKAQEVFDCIKAENEKYWEAKSLARTKDILKDREEAKQEARDFDWEAEQDAIANVWG